MARRKRSPGAAAVPIELGSQAMRFAHHAGVDSDRITLWTSDDETIGRASPKRDGTATITLARGLEQQPERSWVLAHEIAHVALGHTGDSARRLVPLAVSGVLLLIVTLAVTPPVVSMLVMVAWFYGLLALLAYWQRPREHAADLFAGTHLNQWMPHSAVAFLHEREEAKSRWTLFRPFRSHPLPEQRWAAAEHRRNATNPVTSEADQLAA